VGGCFGPLATLSSTPSCHALSQLGRNSAHTRALELHRVKVRNQTGWLIRSMAGQVSRGVAGRVDASTSLQPPGLHRGGSHERRHSPTTLLKLCAASVSASGCECTYVVIVKAFEACPSQAEIN
jgi:hypothetical protein